MLFLPAAALCCLCSALTAMAAQLLQEDLSLTRREGQSVSFSCGGTHQCYYNDETYWYQKKENETFKIIFRFYKSSCEILKQYDHPEKDDFSSERIQNGCALKIDKVKLDHSASYYCSCVVNYDFQFGSGTKLFVSDVLPVKPVVSVYPAASRAHLEGKSYLLCLASGMFPPLVHISWQRQKEDGGLEDVGEGEQLELRESGRSASIRLLDLDLNVPQKYLCSVKHEGGPVKAHSLQELPAPASCPPERPDLAALQQADLSFQSECRVKLLCLLYTVLIVKSLVYCCGLSLLMMLTNQGPSTT
ncbi:immunoglobulin kappa light chain-like [Fundulus heteroclitus]|uniref:immunoglobulin kappa light chain-like n=1 Tax=Fundulus heteroclitus TaxID=8078 RepID=UPI00165BE6F0|nr:immunoglobulin kappa light chain-like [Fundulus heteroclitus]